jgi:hypothetical protein
MYKKIGTIEDFNLDSFNWQISMIQYDWINNLAFVNILINHVMIRVFKFECSDNWSYATALKKVLELPEFINSELV